MTAAQTRRVRGMVNNVMLGLTGMSTLLICSVLFFVLGYLFIKGASTLSFNFFTQLPAPVGEKGGGMANAIVGSAKILALATVIGVPIGFFAGVYLAEYGHKGFAFVVQYLTDLLNGVPSIVIGIFAYTLIVLRMHHFSTFAGGVALAIMMIPIAVRSTEEFLHAVPRGLREGALALGAPKWRMLATVVIPAAKQGITTGIMLDLARVAGETAPLLFTSLNNQFWSPGLGQPAASLPVMIFKYATSAYEDWHRQALAAGFVLLMFILTINISARLILSRSGLGGGR